MRIDSTTRTILHAFSVPIFHFPVKWENENEGVGFFLEPPRVQLSLFRYTHKLVAAHMVMNGRKGTKRIDAKYF